MKFKKNERNFMDFGFQKLVRAENKNKLGAIVIKTGIGPAGKGSHPGGNKICNLCKNNCIFKF